MRGSLTIETALGQASQVFPSTSILVWVVGPRDHPEFASLATWLDTAANVRSIYDLEAFPRHETTHDAEPPADLIVFLQARPGQFRDADVARLAAMAPLARLVVVAGSSSDGEPRTGRPLAGVVRVAWHDWRPHFERNLAAWPEATRVTPSVWWLPRTASAVERITHDCHSIANQPIATQPHEPAARRLYVGIEARESAGFEALAEACRAAGHAVARMRADDPRAVHGIDVGIWDEPGWSRHDLQQLAEFVRRGRGAPIVAVLGFPRSDDVAEAFRAGAAAVIGKPFHLSDLVWELHRVARRPQSRELDNRV